MCNFIYHCIYDVLFIINYIYIVVKHVNQTTMNHVYRKAGPTLSQLTNNGSASRSSPRKINSPIL